MKSLNKSRLSLTLATFLPFMPLVRWMLPAVESPTAPSAAIVFRWLIGAAICGYDAISSASSVAISPPTATVGQPYSGSITYSGGHAGAVISMSVQGNCLGSYSLAPGLTVSYNGVNTASVTGTPTGSPGTVPFSITVYDGGGCSGDLSDTRSTSLIIQGSGGGSVGPTMVVAPQNIIAPVGSDVILSGGASGTPVPGYFWELGSTTLSGVSVNELTLHSTALANGGVYTLYATNSAGGANNACVLTMALIPGSNILAFHFTNYVRAQVGTTVNMISSISNAPAAVNTYSWKFSGTSLGVTTSNLTVSALPKNSGTYTVYFNSVYNSVTVVNNVPYDSYWQFGFVPAISVQPAGTNVSSGSSVTFTTTLSGSTYPNAYLYQNGTTLVAQTSLPAWDPSSAALTTNVSFTLPNVNSGNAGSYTVVVTNYWGSITSSPAALTVGPSLSVSAPQGVTNYAGKTVNLTVTPSGTAPFAYQWQRGGGNLSDGGTIAGSATNSLTISPAATRDSGTYQVIVTNVSGSVTSSPALVSIVPTPSLAASLAGGNLSVTGSGGVAGSNYVVEMSTNIASPTNWAPLQTNAVAPNGAISFTATNSAGSQSSFYRLEFP